MIDVQRRQNGGSWVIILLSFIIALMVAILPLPESIALYKPDLVALVLVYWCVLAPKKVGVGLGWVAGLIVDVMQFGLLGQNALSKTVLAFLVIRFGERIRYFSLLQQSIVVFVLLSIDTAILVLIRNVVSGTKLEIWAWMPTVTSMVLWPIIFVFLRRTRRLSRLS